MPRTMGSSRTRRARYRRGLSTSVVNNSSAFGFSVMITASFGLLGHLYNNPSALDIVLFAAGPVVTLAVIETIVSDRFRRRPNPHPTEVIMLGTAANAASVAAALALVYGSAVLLPETVAWLVAPLLGSGAYVLVEGAELAIAEAIQERVLHDPDAEPAE